MIPNLEYLQKLNPNGSAVVARYTYASVDWLKDEYEEEWEEYTNLLGWWEKDKVGTVSANDVDVDIGTAFLGFLGGKNLNFVSAGEVPSEPTAFNDGGNRNPFFLNYLPLTIKLGAVTVTCEDDFMIPNLEYLQVLNPNGSAVIARYTYAGLDWLKDEYEDEWAEHTDLLGWWQKDHVGEEGYSANDVDLTPGFSFLGFLGGKGLDFNFPAAY